MRTYKNYEFCKAVKCKNFHNCECNHKYRLPIICSKTAREFHFWLIENGFEIRKAEVI